MNEAIVIDSEAAERESAVNYGARKRNIVKLLLAYSAVLGIIVCFLPEESSLLDLIVFLPLLFLGISWCLTDASERGHPIGRFMKLSLLFFFGVGLAVYFFQTRGIGGFKALAFTLVLIGAMGICLFVTAFATFYLGDLAGLWEAVY